MGYRLKYFDEILQQHMAQYIYAATVGSARRAALKILADKKNYSGPALYDGEEESPDKGESTRTMYT